MQSFILVPDKKGFVGLLAFQAHLHFFVRGEGPKVNAVICMLNGHALSGSSVYLFGVLHHFQHCTGHITTGSWKGRGNQYIQFVRVLYCICRPRVSNYQLSHLRPCQEPNLWPPSGSSGTEYFQFCGKNDQ